jgi:4-hydroxythreonine-4-phosphate dehydrogenase
VEGLRVIRPVLGITMGDPAGVGPEIAAKALAQADVREKARPLVIGDARVMAAAARVAHVTQAVRAIGTVSQATFAPDRIEVLDLANADPAASRSAA